jgi:CheY-like chemotaxis protein
MISPVALLVVDDDRDTREALRATFEGEGYIVTEASDGVEALDVLRASASPLVVVLDLDLPKLDGIGVLQAVYDDAALAARHAFILLTAVAHQRYQAAEATSMELAVPILQKPVELDTLLDAVTQAAEHLPVSKTY